MNWVEAAKGTTEASSPFEYAARLVEVMLLGVVSLRAAARSTTTRENMRVTNSPTGERPAPPRLPQWLQAHAVPSLTGGACAPARRPAVNSQLRNSPLRDQLPNRNSPKTSQSWARRHSAMLPPILAIMARVQATGERTICSCHH